MLLLYIFAIIALTLYSLALYCTVTDIKNESRRSRGFYLYFAYTALPYLVTVLFFVLAGKKGSLPPGFLTYIVRLFELNRIKDITYLLPLMTVIVYYSTFVLIILLYKRIKGRFPDKTSKRLMISVMIVAVVSYIVTAVMRS